MEKVNTVSISIVVPAYRQEKTIVKDILRIKRALIGLRYNSEIIIVVDGMVDKTFQKAKKLSVDNLKVVGYEQNHGKGYAIRYGMVRAKGNIIGFMDSGMDINPNSLSMLLEHFEWYNADIIAGSKLHPVSKVDYPLQRRVLSLGYRILVRILFGLNVRDTQVGMKFFRRKVLKDVLPRLLVKKYAFDIEILAVARDLGYKRIFEAPIQLNFQNSASIVSKSLWKVIFLMIIDTLGVFYRLKIVRYYDDVNRKKWGTDSDLAFKSNAVAV